MKNTLFTNDNLFVLYGLNSESVDLIYLDPPFNSKRTYSAPVGSKSAGASFKDMWTWQDVDDGYLDKLIEKYPSLVRFIQSIEKIHSKGMMAYITYMTQRLIEMHRVLKDTGSIYLHCDPTASHYLKVTMDGIFGKNNFKNEIIWGYKGIGGKESNYFERKHDVILFYTKSANSQFFSSRQNLSDSTIKRFKKYFNENGQITYQSLKETNPGVFNSLKGLPKDLNTVWLDIKNGAPQVDWWDDISIIRIGKSEATGYPTQKPLALLHRIIKASSKEGDIVFDPFCGCATTCVAAQQLNRKWIGVDIEKQAANVLIERLSDDAGLFADFIHRADTPQRTDIKEEPITTNTKERLFKEQKGCCNACGIELDIWHFEVDHIVPKAKGGGDYYENYQLLCGNCNRVKGDRPMEYLRIKIKQREELMKNKISFGE